MGFNNEINLPQGSSQNQIVEKKEGTITLSEEEHKQIFEFAKKIDITNSSLAISYGSNSQKKLSDFSSGLLAEVRTKDLGKDVSNAITEAVTVLRDSQKATEPGLLGSIFRQGKIKITKLKAQFSTAEANIGEIKQKLEKHQLMLLKDIAHYDRMYEILECYYKELTMYIEAGTIAINNAKQKRSEFKKQAEENNEDFFIAQKCKDLDYAIERFEKRLSDLKLTRTVVLQSMPQIGLLKQNNEVLVAKIQTTISNTIPLWKNQLIISLGIEHSAEAAKAQKLVTNITNDLLRKNAQRLHESTVEIAREAQRGIVDIETLKFVNQELIQTFDDVSKIQSEGRTARQNAEKELIKLENDLKSKLLAVGQNNPETPRIPPRGEISLGDSTLTHKLAK